MYQRVTLSTSSARSGTAADAVFVFSDSRRLPPGHAALDRSVGGAIDRHLRRPEFRAGSGEVSVLRPESSRRVVLVAGLGPREAFKAAVLRSAAARLTSTAFSAGVTALRIDPAPALGSLLGASESGGAVADGIAVAAVDFDRFRGATGSSEGRGGPKSLRIICPAAMRKAMGRGLKVGIAATAARHLAATPPNIANPRYVVSTCRRMARRVGLKCTVIDARRAERLGMGGLCAVGRGGSTPPALICLEWEGVKGSRGRGAGKKSSHPAPILLVGKAVTFDTGGYSLKIGGSMKGMKYDKCGGVAVIGAMEAIALLKVRRRVVGLIPCAENMIDETAYRVDDILTMVNGVTVEVTNTDAEGRLILADALAWGTKRYKPAAVIDLATLTGGVVVALGSACAGMFCNDARLAERLEASAARTGERLWHLPLWDEHRDMMRGTHGDLVNSSDRREAAPIQGAAFLSFFVGDRGPIKMPTLPWVHLDIAGVATRDGDGGLYPKGPTGFGVRLLADLIDGWK